MALSDWILSEGHDHVVAGCKWVKTLERIRCNTTGEVREQQGFALMAPDETAPSDYIWSEGNFSCDCNRELFFLRAGGSEPDLGDAACGEYAYSVQLVNPKDGRVYYDEFAKAGVI